MAFYFVSKWRFLSIVSKWRFTSKKMGQLNSKYFKNWVSSLSLEPEPYLISNRLNGQKSGYGWGFIPTNGILSFLRNYWYSL